jgi:hypothetical protein
MTPQPREVEGVFGANGIAGGGTIGTITLTLDSPVAVQYGGTGGATAAVARNNLFNILGNAVGDTFFRNTTTNIQRLAIGSTGQVLTVGSSGMPIWQTPSGGGGNGGGSGEMQSPWLGTIDAAGNDLVNAGNITIGNNQITNRRGITLISDEHQYSFKTGGSAELLAGGCWIEDDYAQETRIFISSNGNVGLGANIAPAYRLDVIGDINCTGTYRVNGTPIQTGGGGGGGGIQNPWTEDVCADQYDLDEVKQLSLQYAIFYNTNDIVEISLDSSGSLQFSNEDSIGLVWITQAGQVGIGRSAPAYALDVNGNINASAYYQNGQPFSGGGGGGDGWTDTWYGNVNANQHMLTGLAELQIGDNQRQTDARILLRTNASNYILAVTSNSSPSPGALYLWDDTASTTRIMMGSNGNVAIGSDPAAYKLFVNGGFCANGVTINTESTTSDAGISMVSAAGEWTVGVAGTSSSYPDYFFIWDISDQIMAICITPTGNVGIGNYTPSYKLDISGDINITGNIYRNGTQIL